MAVRIFHCGNSLNNYYICIEEKVIGFRHMFKTEIIDNVIYLSVKYKGVTYCGARATVESIVDYAPWENPELYVLCHKIDKLEFCKPINLDFLKNTGGNSWGLIYLIGSKEIKDEKAINLLEKEFNNNITDNLYKFLESEKETEVIKKKRGRKSRNEAIEEPKEHLIKEEQDIVDKDDSNNVEMGEDDNTEIEIMGTFKTIKFKNEMDKTRGLEALVNNNFYKLFHFFDEENSILIPENRLFTTKGKKDTIGVSGIPDALLISFDKNDKNSCLKINIIEYECYGENKFKSTDKFNYLNGSIIPQLIRFASTFSIVTDNSIRNSTINTWIDKITYYIDNNEYIERKAYKWLREIDPEIKTSHLVSQLKEELKLAFSKNIRILLIIDELTSEQRETIKNIIHSFKLSENSKNIEKYIDFAGYVVRLEHMVNINNECTSSYALSFQDN